MFNINRKRKKRYPSFLDDSPEQVNTTLRSREDMKPDVKRVLDRHHKYITTLVTNTCTDVDSVDALKWDLTAQFEVLKQRLLLPETEREDSWEVLRGNQRAGLILDEASLSRLDALNKSVDGYLAAAIEEETL